MKTPAPITAAVAAALLACASSAHAADLKGIPEGPFGQSVQRGYEMIMNTATEPMSKDFVGNTLSCNSCHTEAGANPTPGNFLQTATKFPSYSKREDAVITIEDRIANCFMRSMNGTRPSVDSPVVVDMASYITWLDRGKPILSQGEAKAQSPYTAMAKAASQDDVTAGEKVYGDNCAACHGVDGAGTAASFPPVWGPKSYNAGAGLANVLKLATWVKGNMPLGNAHLTEKEAFEVALYVDAHPRPEFVLSRHLSPGSKADDYNAKVRAETDTVESNLKREGLAVHALH